jgi:hypothetical protein
MNFFTSYVSHLTEPSEKPPLTNVNLEYIEKLTALTNMFDKLYFKINLKLGGVNITKSSKIEKSEQVVSYVDFLSTLSTVTNPIALPVLETQIANNRPRLDTFITDLTRCKDALSPYVDNINKLRYLNSDKQKGEFDIKETQALLEIYTKINEQVFTGINSYIQVLPMIFFTVEFPPVIYKDSTCKYKLTYDSGKELVTYKPSPDANFMNCKNLKVGDFEQVDLAPSLFSSHAAFFESNNANGTKKIIDDPVIGLDKLIKFDTDKQKPVNNVINIMFALGASGTGKTTRYFGKENAANPDDVTGIIPFVIKNALTNNKDVGNTVSLAYFVCYGRANSDGSSFDESLIFFNIDKIQKSVLYAEL